MREAVGIRAPRPRPDAYGRGVLARLENYLKQSAADKGAPDGADKAEQSPRDSVSTL